MGVHCEMKVAKGAGEVLGSPMLVNVLWPTLFQVVQDEGKKLRWRGKSGISRVWVWPKLLHNTFDKWTPGLVLLQLHKLLVVD